VIAPELDIEFVGQTQLTHLTPGTEHDS